MSYKNTFSRLDCKYEVISRFPFGKTGVNCHSKDGKKKKKILIFTAEA